MTTLTSIHSLVAQGESETLELEALDRGAEARRRDALRVPEW
jgi:hypothetical protein